MITIMNNEEFTEKSTAMNTIDMKAVIDDLHEYMDAEAEMYGYSTRGYKYSYDPYLLSDNENSYVNIKSDDYKSNVSLNDDYGNVHRKYNKEEWYKQHVIETFLLHNTSSGYNDMIQSARGYAKSALNAADSMFSMRVMQGLEIWGMQADEAVLVDMKVLLSDNNVMQTMADYNKTVDEVVKALTDSYNRLINDDYVQDGADVVRNVVNINTEWLRAHIHDDSKTGNVEYENRVDNFMKDKINGRGIPWYYITPGYYHLATFYLAGMNNLLLVLELINDGMKETDIIHVNKDFITNERIECIIGTSSDDYIDKHGMVAYFNLLGSYPFTMKGFSAIMSVVLSRFTELPEPDDNELTDAGRIVYNSVTASFGKPSSME